VIWRKLRTSSEDDTSAPGQHRIGPGQVMFAAQAWSPAICHGSGQNTGLPTLASAIAWSIDNCCSRANSAVATVADRSRPPLQ
jgi:hypothetical protein